MRFAVGFVELNVATCVLLLLLLLLLLILIILAILTAAHSRSN